MYLLRLWRCRSINKVPPPSVQNGFEVPCRSISSISVNAWPNKLRHTPSDSESGNINSIFSDKDPDLFRRRFKELSRFLDRFDNDGHRDFVENHGDLRFTTDRNMTCHERMCESILS